MTVLEVADPLAFKDLAAFTSLAHRLDPDGAMRFQVSSDVLVVTVAPLFPHGIGDSTPLVLAMRMLKLTGPSLDGLDEVVLLSNLGDRFARDDSDTRLSLPPNSVLVSWSGIAPPRGPWERRDDIASETLKTAAEAGIGEVGQGTPEGAGSHAVTSLRARIWSRPISAHNGTEVPQGVAFAALGLNFLPRTDTSDQDGAGNQLPVFSSPGWIRVVAPGGHLLTRSRG